MAERAVLPVFLQQRENQHRTRLLDWIAFDFKRRGVRAAGFVADAPAVLRVGAAIDSLGNRVAAFAVIGRCVLKSDLLLVGNANAGCWGGHGVEVSFPDGLPLRVKREHFEIGEASAKTAVRAVPDGNFFERRVGTKVEFPPRTVLGFGHCGGCRVEVPIGVAIDGTAGFRAAVGGRLARFALGRDVFALVENLDFRQ